MTELSLFPVGYDHERGHGPVVEDVQLTGWRAVVKDCLDPVIALIVLVLVSPALLYLALLVRLSGRGPVLIRQTRIGRLGRPFTLLKFRTVAWSSSGGSAEDEVSPLLATLDGGVLPVMPQRVRLTRIGRLLRLTGLDELPQLLNVLTGTMSLVGPRPRLPQQAAELPHEALPLLLAKPGLVGLSQVAGVPGGPDRDVLDLHYVRGWSFALDVAIVLRSIRRLFEAPAGIRDPFADD